MITTNGLSKVFRVQKKEPGLAASVRALFSRQWIEKEAVKNITLNIEAGEIVGLIGANGAGKTTLVKMLAGIIHPSKGEASVLGYTPWKRENVFRRQVALIMGQKSQLWWDLPASDGFILLKEIYQIPDHQFKKTLADLTDALQVHDQMKVQLRKLSLGERMKMELIAALLHQPKVVFLDEPTIGLDVGAQRAIRDFLLSYRKEHRPAMILTSHYMEDIQRLCERVVILRQGEMVYDGSLREILNRYADEKQVAAKIPQDIESITSEIAVLKTLCEKIVHETGLLKMNVKREKVLELTQYLLLKLKIEDITIEDEDISTIIEALIRAKK